MRVNITNEMGELTAYITCWIASQVSPPVELGAGGRIEQTITVYGYKYINTGHPLEEHAGMKVGQIKVTGSARHEGLVLAILTDVMQGESDA